MKYTIVIRQPVDAARQPELEQQLIDRFGLNAEQARKLAARRAGRLMKPTSRARAELLLSVFQSVDAEVALETVHEDTQQLSEPFQGVAPLPTARRVADPHDDTLLAPLLPATAWPSPMAPVSSAPEPSGITSAGASSGGRTATLDAPPETRATAQAFGGLTAAPDLSVFGDSAGTSFPFSSDLPPPTTNPFEPGSPSSVGSSAAALEDSASSLPSADVWSDFTGGLGMPETETPETPGTSAAPIAPMLVPGVGVGELGKGAGLRRNSLARQLTLGALVPLVLASAVTLGVLALTLPTMQRQVVQANARTVAAAVGANLTTGSQSLTYAQLDSIIAGSDVGFVRVEVPGGASYLRSRNPELNGQFNTQLTDWTRTHPNSGTLKLDGTEYVVSRVTFREDKLGRAVAAPVNAGDDQYVRRITVGLPNAQAATNLRNTLLLVLLASLLGLGLAGVFAARAARQVTEPIQRLVRAADAISMGDLSRPVQAARNDEIGDLAQALERMRLSLEAAMERLRRRRRN
ncbi:HAMP domain-containing protein [Deinococcus aerophilus]|uniref:HAMP domain-containing protein n=1 Tax=Deinococcus aerophilus TaxID=522488 RepID=A0ABQ2GQ50_9DEIO|nr:HAMP domain-containing protein [Deinococcus aerophilus]GGM05435.1 HAMP domain-containing protein [Deinococcus aerophilus]